VVLPNKHIIVIGLVIVLTLFAVNAVFGKDDYTNVDSLEAGLANKLHAALDRCNTDEDSVYSVFGQIQSNVMFQKLVNKFGVRVNRGCFPLFPDFMQPQHNLYEWIQDKLTLSERTQVNSILSNNNVTYQV